MEVTFDVGYHGDLFVTVDGQKHDFGYNHYLHFPLEIWFAGLQLQQGNVFKRTTVRAAKRKCFSRETHDVLEKAKDFARELPLELSQFISEAQIQGFCFWSGGNHKIKYNCDLQGRTLHYLQQVPRDSSLDREVFCIPECEFVSVVQQYADFASRCEKIGKYVWEIPAAIAALKEVRTS